MADKMRNIYLILMFICNVGFAGWYSQAEIDANKARYANGLSESFCINKHGSCREYIGDIECVTDIAGVLTHDVAKCTARDAAKQVIIDDRNQEATDRAARLVKIIGFCDNDFGNLTATQKNQCWREIFKSIGKLLGN